MILPVQRAACAQHISSERSCSRSASDSPRRTRALPCPLALEYPPEPRARRPRHAGRLRAGAAAAQGAARHRPGNRRRVRRARRHSRRWRPRRTAISTSSSSGRAFLLERLTAAHAAAGAGRAGKAIVEHTAINPNKAAHIGHLRNSALGDTLVRVLRFRGIPVEVQNYIDDTGVQVADVVVGFRVLEGKTLDEIRAIADSTRFDYYCWDLYARVTEWYERRQGAAAGPRRRRCTTSSTAATRTPRSPRSSPTASSAAT